MIELILFFIPLVRNKRMYKFQCEYFRWHSKVLILIENNSVRILNVHYTQTILIHNTA